MDRHAFAFTARTTLAALSALLVVYAPLAAALRLDASPEDAVCIANTSHVFSVRAEDVSGAAHYLWQRDGVSIQGAAGATLVLNPVTPQDAGLYRCVVSDDAGNSVVTSEARLKVLFVARDPEDAVCVPGQSHAFLTEPGGAADEPFAFQWFKDGVPIAGAADARLVLEPVRAADHGTYHCEIRLGDLVLKTARAVLQTSATPLLFDAHPVSAVVYEGEPHTFQTAVSGGIPPLRYQWRRDAADIPGVAEAAFTLTSASAADAGTYDCLVSDAEQTIPSRAAVLRVSAHLALTEQPEGAVRATGQAHTFRAAVCGGKRPLSYQWRVDDADIRGAAALELYINPLARAHSGSYTCVITDAGGERAISAAAALDVLEPLRAVINPAAQDCYVGQAAEWCVAVSGGKDPYQYQWQRAGADIPGAVSVRFAAGPLTEADAGAYICVVTDARKEKTVSGAAALAVFPMIRILRQPLGGARYAGDTFELSVETTGGIGGLAYRWRRGETPIDGAAEPILKMDALTLEQKGLYVCTVTDSRKAAIASQAAFLDVADRVRIDSQPYGGDYFEGERHEFAITASGGIGPLRYEWRCNDVPINGAVTPAYRIDPLAHAHAGQYTCIVRDSAAQTRTSDPVIVTVLP